MMLKKIIASKGFGIFLLLLALVVAVKLPVFGVDYYWDETLYVAHAKYYSTHGLFAVPPEDYGQVPFFEWNLAAVYALFGESPFLTHLVTTLYAFVAVYFTYLWGRKLFNERVGIAAALLLLFSTMFFTISSQALHDTPLTALVMATLYFGAGKRISPYLVSASVLVLTKEPGLLAVVSVVIYHALSKENVRNILPYAIPLVVLAAWEVLYFAQTGNIGYKHPDVALLQAPSITGTLTKATSILYVMFFASYRWVLTVVLAASILKKRISNIPNDATLLATNAVLFLALFSVLPGQTFLARYMLPAYPAIFLLFAYAASKMITKKAAYVIFTAVVTALFISTYWWNVGPKLALQDPVAPSRHTLWSSLENYVLPAQLETQATRFIINNYPNTKVMAGFPFAMAANIAENIGYKQWDKYGITLLYPPDHDKLRNADIVVYESFGVWNKTATEDAIIKEVLGRMKILGEFGSEDKKIILYGR